jgi:hypothetical protein
MTRPSTQAPEHDPLRPATSVKTGNETIADFAKIRKAILSGKPGRIGFTRFSHLAFCPPYRRSIDAKRRSAPGAGRATEQ